MTTGPNLWQRAARWLELGHREDLPAAAGATLLAAGLIIAAVIVLVVAIANAAVTLPVVAAVAVWRRTR